jgi:two-component system, chemotaxis family, protein-glutamate methylesterase/glutaminase
MGGSVAGLVVVGASAGGVEPLKRVFGALPADLDATFAVVLHVPESGSRLPKILSDNGLLPAKHAEDGELLEAGHVYVAPPDRHLLVRAGRCVVARGPREHGHRPAVDPLFRSAALEFGPRTVAVVLSGALSDGSVGAAAVASQGGTVIVQDPDEADFPSMPAMAITRDHPDCVMPVDEIAAAIVETVRNLPQAVQVRDNGRNEMILETSYATLDRDAVERAAPPGRPSAFACPACGGVLWEVDDSDDLPRYRCRVGHAYTSEAVLDDEAAQVDRALWAAFRALHERAHLSARSARRLRERNAKSAAARFEKLAHEALGQAELIRTVLLERDGPDG